MAGYPQARLYEELSFLAYHVGWNLDQLLALPHGERARWCAAVSDINERLNEEAEVR
jgi:hypothetical protein